MNMQNMQYNIQHIFNITVNIIEHKQKIYKVVRIDSSHTHAHTNANRTLEDSNSQEAPLLKTQETTNHNNNNNNNNIQHTTTGVAYHLFIVLSFISFFLLFKEVNVCGLVMDASQDHPLLTSKERAASIGDGTPPKIVVETRPRKNSLPTYDKPRPRKQEIDLLEGEKIVTKIPHVSLLRKGEIDVLVPRGDLFLTNFQLVYKPSVASFKKNGAFYVQKNNVFSSLHAHSSIIQQQVIRNMAFEEVRVPLMIINYCRKKSGKDVMKLRTYDMRELRFTFSFLDSEPPKLFAPPLPPSPSNMHLDERSEVSGDIDLSSSLSHLHTAHRTIGARPGMPGKSNSSSSILNTSNGSLAPGYEGLKSAGGRNENISGAKVAEKVYEYISRFGNLQGSLDLFAFHHKLLPAPDQAMDGWFIYDPIKEFTRMGIPDAGWTISGVNNSYELCPTYPPFLSIPRAMSDPVLLRRCADFRSKGRLPTLCWKSPMSLATITRCSQPLVGYKGARCPEDELLVSKILELNPVSDELYIIDARPKVNALANQAGGEGGWESMSAYKSCRVLFMGLENIHIIRESYNKLFSLINSGSQSWDSELDSSGWLKHIRAILLAAREVTSTITLGKSVMIHCSDGWDRTALISSLAQMSLDPYFRTTRGFQILIEKEWLSFGHKFGDRTGHSEGQKMNSSEKSPVFLQFLDCVSQFLTQFPTSFQFSNTLLLLLAEHVYSCRFGTFLCNSDCERMRQSISSRTVSIWTCISFFAWYELVPYFDIGDINANMNQFLNPFYDDKSTPTLFVSCAPQSIALWSSFYLRHHPPIASSRYISVPGLSSTRVNLDLISSTIPTLVEDGVGSKDTNGNEIRGSVAFLNKPSLNVYPLAAHDTVLWSPMALIEKRAREMAMHIQQLETELQALRKNKGKAGNFTEYSSFLRMPKPSPSINNQAVKEAKNTIDLILLRTFETIAARQYKRKNNHILIGGRTNSNNLFAPPPPSTPSPPTTPRPHTPTSPATAPRSPRSLPATPASPRNSITTPPLFSPPTPPIPIRSSSPKITQSKPPIPPKNRSLSDSVPIPLPPYTSSSSSSNTNTSAASTSVPQTPPAWIRDSYSSSCEECGRGFTKVWRKHHCRSCGMIFCGNCSKRKIPIPNFQYFHPVRVCDKCYEHLAKTSI